MREFVSRLGLETIDGYSFIKALGSGKAAMTCLYSNRRGENRIVKMLIAPRTDEEHERFEAEARTLMELTIKGISGIPRAYSGLRQHNDFPVFYYVTEFIDGTTLWEYIDSHPLPWNWRESLSMIGGIALALSDIAARGIIHRDLHPGNIMLRRGFTLSNSCERNCENIVILDIGCVKNWFLDLVRQSYDEAYEAKTYLRHFGAVSTWSPEFLQDPGNVGLQHDIWALGVLFYLLVTGAYPVESRSFGELYRALVIHYNLDWEKVTKRQVPEEIIHVMKCLLAQDPGARYSHGGVAYVCEAILEDDLLHYDKNLVNAFLDAAGDLWVCPDCIALVRPSGNRCPNCGHFADAWLPWYSAFISVSDSDSCRKSEP